MEVMKMNELNCTIDELTDSGCLAQPFTVNGEKWVYIIHPVTGKRKEHE